ERSASELAIPPEVKKKSTGVAPHRTAASIRVPSHGTIVFLLSDLIALATTIEPIGYCSLKLPARPEEIQISTGRVNAFLSSSCARRIPIPVLTMKISPAKSGAPSPAPISDSTAQVTRIFIRISYTRPRWPVPADARAALPSPRNHCPDTSVLPFPERQSRCRE